MSIKAWFEGLAKLKGACDVFNEFTLVTNSDNGLARGETYICVKTHTLCTRYIDG